MSKHKAALLSLLNPTHLLLPARLDWDKILRIADYSKAQPLLFSRIKDAKERLGIPETIYNRLQNAYKNNLIRNTLVLEEFDRIGSFLKGAHVPVILLKGIFLLHTVYKEKIGLRRMEDVDILIKEEDFKKTDQLLRTLGYRPKGDDCGGRKTIMYFGHGRDNFILAPIHLHRHIVNVSLNILRLNWSKINMRYIWDSATPVGPQGSGNIFMMEPETALLSLCEHAFRHAFSRIMLLYDIHLFIEQHKDSLDWDILRRCAREWGLSVPLYMGLVLSRKTFKTAIPDDFFCRVRPEASSLPQKCFLSYIQASDFPCEDMGSILYLAVNRKFSDKLRFFHAAFNKIM
jgi:hypothetical protein